MPLRVVFSLLVPLALSQSILAADPHAYPQRIISYAPNLTETLFALGAGERVVGISDFCGYPSEAMNRKRCGAYSPNYEGILSLKPDLIVAMGQAAKLRDFCEKRKIPFLSLSMNSVASIKGDIMTLGQRLGLEDSATSMCKKIDADLADVRAHKITAPATKTLLSISRAKGATSSILTAGGGTFLDEMLQIAGGTNIFADRKEPYPQVSKETLIQRQPDIILELRPGETIDPAYRKDLLNDWAPFSSLPAVKNNKIIFITDPSVEIAGPRVGRIAHLFLEALQEATANPKNGNGQADAGK